MRRIAFAVALAALWLAAGLGYDLRFLPVAQAQQSSSEEGPRARSEPADEAESEEGTRPSRRGGGARSDDGRSRTSKPAGTNADAADGAPPSASKPPSRGRTSPQNTRDPIEQRLQAAERPANVELHPVAAANPDHNVIVCVAGCPNGRNSIVHMKRRVETQPAPQGPIIAAADSVSVPTPSVNAIVCVAGCYDTPKALPAAAPPAPKSRDQAGLGASGTRAPFAAAASERVVGRWLTTVSTAEDVVRAPRPRVVTRRPARKSASAEWFTSRFRRQ